ncbi:MAG: hypothetical protein RIE56_14725, partial [Amphiplicatus sp.]
MTKKSNETGGSKPGASEFCERLADTAIDLFVDYLQQALKSNPGLKLDAQELAFQSRQFKKDEKERYLIRTQKAAEAW